MARKTPVTRFAPSPTGFLHIGGARTALFNYLFARHHGGKYLLRIEDTDIARSTPEATQAIVDGLDWLGLNPDGDIVYQSRNADRHAQIAHKLVKLGHAYRCYLTSEQAEDQRRIAQNEGRAFRSPYRENAHPDGDGDYVVRFKVPDGQTRIDDLVQGHVSWENSDFDDLVLLRADGTPTYMLAVIVDDHDMGVTHVIRGDDHLINAARQKLMIEAMEWDVPDYAHVPLIHGPDGKKLSKRHGALGVDAYRDMGYIAPGLRNYLMKLGWSHGDDEIFSDENAIAAFNLSGIVKSPARLDFDKMDYINGQHILLMSNEDLLAEALPFLIGANDRSLTDAETVRVTRAVDALKPRSKTLKEMAEQARYLLLSRPLQITGKTAKPLRREGVLPLMQALTLTLKSLEDTKWTADAVHMILDRFVSDNNIGFGKIGQPVRAALTAGHPSPDLSQVIYALGREETLGRLEDALRYNS
ncbi:glutamate--tRNA ligase [Robiginitomaculum antarcticum]|uniref:glutamate--tRNA ligase n=1 Tax=Robiginitomaculum antarcticum TaxID=437507 RepID=UPI00037F22CB|nr:glutamate--tRNA ligase [Robiginitomaculum antarcticum]